MAYNSTIALDQISSSQSGKEATANALFAACSAAALWGIKTSATTGLTFTLYGGNMNIAGVPTAIASQAMALTANATNYIYATAAGVVTKTTSAPTGWPGPITSPSGAIALYQLVVGTATITSGTCYVVGLAAQGATGATGAQGPEGANFAETRTRLWTANGAGSTNDTFFGFEALTLTGTSASARALGSSSLRESIAYAGYPTGAGAGSSAQVNSPRNFCYLGNAAGRGGFTLSMRFCMENSVNASPANMRSFFGLFVPAAIGNVEPDTLTSIIGIGSLAGDANFSVMHNDGSGTATKVALGANFPVRGTDNVYELVLDSVANSGTVSYTLTDIGTGNAASGTISSDLPANTTFLSWAAWVNNGSTAAVASMGLMQVVGETRY